jgi:hypothetical protein
MFAPAASERRGALPIDAWLTDGVVMQLSRELPALREFPDRAGPR